MKYNWINTEMFVLQVMETSVVYACGYHEPAPDGLLLLSWQN